MIALTLLGAAPAAGATLIDRFDNFSIGTGVNAIEQNGKLQAGSPSTCDPPKAAPGVDNGTFNIDGFTEQSFINETACLTIEYSTADAQCLSDGLFSASYDADLLGLSDIQSGYLGDVGAAPTTSGTPVSYEAPLAAGGLLQLIFSMNTQGAGCPDIDVKVFSDRPWLTFGRQPIAGHPFVGETLTSRRDRWLGASAFTEQWRRCARDGSSCVDIPGATAETYVPVPDDVGHTLRVHVTASDGVKTSTADSDPLLIGIQFDAVSGQTLSASDPTQNGRLTRTALTSSCTLSPAKPAPPLSPSGGGRFYDAFRRTNASDGTLCTMVSIDYPSFCSNNADRPFSAAYLPGFDPASVRTNYLADGGVAGFNGERTVRYSFNVPAGAGYDVVVATITAGVTCPSYDLRFGTASPYPTGPPSVDGTAQAGQMLTAIDGTWSGTPSFVYQWQRCFGDGSGCGDIPGATGKTLALTDKNVGDAFRVRVTASEGIGSASKTSALSGAVAEAPPVPPPPPPPDPPAYTGIPLTALTKVVGGKGLVALRLVCPPEALVGCAGTDVVRLGKATLALRPFAMGPGKTAAVRFSLSKAVRKRLAKRKRLNVTQIVNSSDVRGLPVRTSAGLTLRPKRRG